MPNLHFADCFRSDGAPPPPAPALQASQLQLGKHDPNTGWLESILVYGGDGWSLDLSSQFSPDVPEYGVIVPADFESATLCVQPYQGQHQCFPTDIA